MTKGAKKDHRIGTRITVTVPPDHYEHVCLMAKAKKVSNAWIIRDAVEKYIESESGPNATTKGL